MNAILFRALAFVCALQAIAVPASGCTVCGSPSGAAVRAGIFNPSFTPTFLEVAAPIPALVIALYVVSRLLPE
jgi:hypothetical protein